MSNPVFIVDGFTEQKIIQNICPGHPIRRTDLNGKSVAIQAIAKKIAVLIRLLGNRYHPIIILTDKEQRNISFSEMAQQIHHGLQQEGILGQDIRIGVADRMLENWILADWTSLTGDDDNKPHSTDGLNGASVIRRTNGSYNKITDGVELFLKGSPVVMYENSPSFQYFIKSLNGIKCKYLEFAGNNAIDNVDDCNTD